MQPVRSKEAKDDEVQANFEKDVLSGEDVKPDEISKATNYATFRECEMQGRSVDMKYI